MFIGTHYGVEVIVNYLDPEEDVLTQAIESFDHANIKYELLPIDVCLPDSHAPVFVFNSVTSNPVSTPSNPFPL